MYMSEFIEDHGRQFTIKFYVSGVAQNQLNRVLSWSMVNNIAQRIKIWLTIQ